MPHSRPRNVSSNDTFDYYEELSVAPSADDQQIKKAYRRLALLWHPDKNPQSRDEAERRFKRIAEAYEVLSNKEKRRAYDGRGAAPSCGDPLARDAFHFRSPFDVFHDFFGGVDPFEHFIGRRDASFDLFDQLFAGPLRRRAGEPVQRYTGGLPGFFNSSFHFDPFRGVDESGSRFSSTTRFEARGNGDSVSSHTTSTLTSLGENGQRVVTKRTVADGRETVERFNGDTLVSRTITRTLAG